MRLQRYLDRLHNTLTSRKELVVEQLHIEIIIPEQAAVIAGRIRYWNDSLLEFTETLSMRNMVLAKRAMRIIIRTIMPCSFSAMITHRIIPK